MKLRKLKCHCAAPSKGMCSPGHKFLVKFANALYFNCKSKFSPPSHVPLVNAAFEWLWAFGDLHLDSEWEIHLIGIQWAIFTQLTVV